MRRTHLFRLLLVLTLPALALAAEKASVADILKDPKKYDSKEVEVTGTVKDFKQRTSKIGNKYYTLKLKDADKELSVYGRGTLEPAPKEGGKVQVSGLFRAENKVGDNVFKNEIDCSAKEGKKFGVKEIK